MEGHKKETQVRHMRGIRSRRGNLKRDQKRKRGFQNKSGNTGIEHKRLDTDKTLGNTKHSSKYT